MMYSIQGFRLGVSLYPVHIRTIEEGKKALTFSSEGPRMPFTRSEQV